MGTREVNDWCGLLNKRWIVTNSDNDHQAIGTSRILNDLKGRGQKRNKFFFVLDSSHCSGREYVLKAVNTDGWNHEYKLGYLKSLSIQQALALEAQGYVLPIEDYFDHRGFLCVVSPKMEGDLDMLVLDPAVPSRLLSAESRSQIAVRCCEHLAAAVSVIHRFGSKGYLHRDIKPSNILLSADPRQDASFIACLSDFELVVDTLARETLPLRTDECWPRVGSAAYFAPELTEGRRRERRTDIFAIGAVVYEILTGHHFLDLVLNKSLIDKRSISSAMVEWKKIDGRLPTLEVPYGYEWLMSLARDMLAVQSSKRPYADAVIRRLKKRVENI